MEIANSDNGYIAGNIQTGLGDSEYYPLGNDVVTTQDRARRSG